MGSRVSEGTCVPSQARQRGAGLCTWRATVGEARWKRERPLSGLLSPTRVVRRVPESGRSDWGSGVEGVVGQWAKRLLEVKSPASLPRARGRPEASLSGQSVRVSGAGAMQWEALRKVGRGLVASVERVDCLLCDAAARPIGVKTVAGAGASVNVS